MCESNPDSDSNLDSELLRLDSDSELECKNPDSDSRKKGWIRIQDFWFRSQPYSSSCPMGPSMTNWIQIQSSWIRIRIQMQEKRDGFRFSWIRIQSAWIRIRVRIQDVRIRTSLVRSCCFTRRFGKYLHCGRTIHSSIGQAYQLANSQ